MMVLLKLATLAPNNVYYNRIVLTVADFILAAAADVGCSIRGPTTVISPITRR